MVKEKKDTKELLNELEQEMVRVEKEKVDLRNDKERIAYLEHLCENIKEAKKQCEDIKFEYGQVTSYLKDIQLIDRAPDCRVDERAQKEPEAGIQIYGSPAPCHG